MTQIPDYFGARYPGISRRAVPALALWLARNGALSPATDGTPITFSGGATTALGMAKDAQGRLVRTAEQLPLIHMLDLDGDGVLETPAMQITCVNTNNVPRSQDFTNWTATNSPAILTPTLTLGELVLSLLQDNSGTLQEFYQSPAINTGGNLTARTYVSIFIAKGHVNAAAGSGLTVWDNTAGAARLNATWTWATNGVGLDEPVLNASVGLVLGKEYYGRHLYRHPSTGIGVLTDVWRVSFRTNTNYVPANVNYVRVYPAATAAQQGAEFFGGAMVAYEPGPYIITAGTAATNGLHDWQMTFEGVPQAATLAVRFVASGTPQCIVSGSGILAAVTNAALALPQLGIYHVSDGYMAQISDGVNPVVNATISSPPNANDDVLLRVSLGADGSITLGQTINGGTETVATGSTPQGLPASWPANPRVVLSAGGRGSERYLGIGVFAGAPSASYLLGVVR